MGNGSTRNERRLEQHVRQQLEPHGEVPAFSAEVILDTPFLGIVRVAAELNVDLIVMGTHGRAGLKRLVLGSGGRKGRALCTVSGAHSAR